MHCSLREGAQGEELPGANIDFSTLVSAVSDIYNRGLFITLSSIYLPADARALSPLGKGSVYAIYNRKTRYRVRLSPTTKEFPERNEKVVLKNPQRIFNNDGTVIDQDDLRSLLTEIQVLSHHPLYFHENIVTLLGIKWHCEQLALNPAAQPQLILEFAEWTLEDFLEEHEELSFGTRVRLDLDMILGLEALHGCGLVHGAINPSNVFIKRLPNAEANSPSREYIAQLANFNNSFVNDGVPRRLLNNISEFIPPEVMRGEDITNFNAVDIYSLGITMWRTTLRNISLTVLKDIHAAALPGLENLQMLASEINETRETPHAVENLLFPELLRPVISNSPEDRDLGTLKATILLCTNIRAPIPQTPEQCSQNELELLSSATIHINYQAFKHASSLVKDQIVSSLERIASNPNDMRNPRALYELGVCHISKFGDPNKSNVSLGVHCILQAAQKGDITAKAYASRLHESCLESSDMSEEIPAPTRTQWLLEAATEGFETAYEEFTEGGTNREKKMEILRLRWKDRCHYSLELEFEGFKKQMAAWLGNEDSPTFHLNPSNDTPLHWAAELNLIEHLRFLLQDMSLPIDKQNISGNTPLMAACATGQLDTALLLVELGADVNAKNHRGENVLHFLWRFSDEDAAQLLQKLVENDVDFDQEAFKSSGQTGFGSSQKIAAEKDPLPLLPGKAIERIAARGRVNILREFFRMKPPSESNDSGSLFSIKLWATLLCFSEIRDLLAPHWADNKIDETVTIDQPLFSSHDNARGDDNNKRYFMSLVARGWLSGVGNGWDTPEIFWRMCCHGSQWETRLQKTIFSVSLQENPLCIFEDILLYSCLMQYMAFTRTFLTLYIHEHTSPKVGNDGEKGDICVNHKNRDEKWCGFDIEDSSSSVRGRVSLIDRILFSNHGTLVQFAIIFGNRELFSMLVKDFAANVARPWSDTSSTSASSSTDFPRRQANSGRLYVNCYTLLALSSQDIWFAHEFRILGIPINHLSPSQGKEVWLQRQMEMALHKPLISSKKIIREYLPPLSHALDMGFYRLATFLLDSGADLNEPVSVMGNVFDRALSAPLISVDTIRFLFGQRGFYRKLDGTMGQIHSKLLPLRLFDQENGRRVFDLIQDKYNQPSLPAPGHILSSFKKSGSGIFGSKGTIFFAGLYESFRLLEIVLTPFSSLVSHMCNSSPLCTGPDMMGNEYLLYPDQPKQANEHERSLKEVWEYLLLKFDRTGVYPEWRWTSLLPHRSRSLLSLAATSPYTISETKLWYIATSFYWGTAKIHPFACCRFKKTFNSCRICASNDSSRHCRMDSTIKMVLNMYEQTVVEHRPSLIDIFLWNDYDLLPESYADILFEIGYRHSFFYFAEIRIISSILMVSVFLFLAVCPLVIVKMYTPPWQLILSAISVISLPAIIGFFHSLIQLIRLLRHWCESGNFLWPMVTGKKRYTGYGARQIFRAFVGVFIKRSERVESERVSLRTLS